MQTVQSFLYLHACWRSCTQFTAAAGQVRTHAQKYFQKMARISASGTPGSKVSKGVAAGRREADDVPEECVGFASGDSTDSSAAKACNVTRDTDEDSGQVASNRVASRQIASDGEGSR